MQNSTGGGAPEQRHAPGYDTTLPAGNIYRAPCPILRALEIIGGKWKLPLLWRLAAGAARFNALQRALTGITHMMLSKCLRELERDGLVSRTDRGGKVRHVQYALTERGRLLLPTLRELYRWGERNWRGRARGRGMPMPATALPCRAQKRLLATTWQGEGIRASSASGRSATRSHRSW